MGTDVPGIECVNHAYGPSVNCSCNRFYPDTDCNPPRFFIFDFEDTQSDALWTWLNSSEWAQVLQPSGTVCEWRWNWYIIGEPANLQIAYGDNPSFDGEDSTPQFKVDIRVQNLDDMLLPVGFIATILFGPPNDPIDRDQEWDIEESDWSQEFGNPFENPPTGDANFEPAFCQPDWDPQEIPPR